MTQAEEERIVRLMLFVGMNGSGKSHGMRKWLRANQRNLILPASRSDKMWAGIPELKPQIVFKLDRSDPAGKRKRAVITLPGIDTFQGNRVVHIEGTNAERAAIFSAVMHRNTGFKDGGLFMDDFKNYIPTQSLLPGEVRTYFGNRRLHMVDIFMAAWQFQDCNADLFGFGPQLFVYNVERPPNKSVQDKINDFPGLMAVWQRVRDSNAKLPQDKRWYYEPFPQITLAHATPGTAAVAAADQSRR